MSGCLDKWHISFALARQNSCRSRGKSSRSCTSIGVSGGNTVTSRSIHGQKENQNMLARKLRTAGPAVSAETEDTQSRQRTAMTMPACKML